MGLEIINSFLAYVFSCEARQQVCKVYETCERLSKFGNNGKIKNIITSFNCVN